MDGDFNRKERIDHKAGGPPSVSATIDRSAWKRVRLGDVCEISKGEQLNRAILAERGRIPGKVFPEGCKIPRVAANRG